MKKSLFLSMLALNFLTCGLTLCSDSENDYKKSIEKASRNSNAVQQINQKKEADNYRNADKRRMQLLGQFSQSTTKKVSGPIPGSAAYAELKNKK